MIDTKDIEATKKLLARETSPKIVRAQDNNYTRAILAYGKFDLLLADLKRQKHDTLKYLDTDLDRVSARLAAQKNIAYCISLEELRSLSSDKLAQELARLSQTLKLCKKAKTPLALSSVYDAYNAKALLTALGASTEQAAKALVF